MKNSGKLLELINSYYGHKIPYDFLIDIHSEIIAKYSCMWTNIATNQPKLGTRCFAVQNLSPIGKGTFVGDYYYMDCGFVANKFDNDAYGHITHWISFDAIDNLIKETYES